MAFSNPHKLFESPVQVLPTIQQVSELHGVSFYRLLNLKTCILSGLGPDLKLSWPLPQFAPSKAALIGRAHHLFMELASTAQSLDQLEEQIEAHIEAIQAEADGWPSLRREGSVGGWDKINQSASLAMRRFRNRGNRPVMSSRQNEKALQSTDGMMHGRPDAFVIEDRVGYLIEHKSSDSCSNGELPEQFEEQLQFYAVLLFDSYSLDSVRGSVEFLDGVTVIRVFTRKAVQSFRENIINTITEVNTLIRAAKSAEQLASPSCEACVQCGIRLICTAFKKVQRTILQAASPLQIDIHVTAVAPLDSSRSVVVGSDRFTDTKWRLSLPEPIAKELRLGRTYVFADMAGSYVRPQWLDCSTVYSYE
jgi:hypothetical protein